MSPKGGEFHAVYRLGVARPGFGELPRDATDFHHGYTGVVGQYDSHLENYPEAIPDGVSGGIEGLGTVAGLK